MSNDFYRKALAVERKKLQAVRTKLDDARRERNILRMASLAQTAADIAGRYQIMLDNLLLKEQHNA